MEQFTKHVEDQFNGLETTLTPGSKTSSASIDPSSVTREGLPDT